MSPDRVDSVQDVEIEMNAIKILLTQPMDNVNIEFSRSAEFM